MTDMDEIAGGISKRPEIFVVDYDVESRQQLSDIIRSRWRVRAFENAADLTLATDRILPDILVSTEPDTLMVLSLVPLLLATPALLIVHPAELEAGAAAMLDRPGNLLVWPFREERLLELIQIHLTSPRRHTFAWPVTGSTIGPGRIPRRGRRSHAIAPTGNGLPGILSWPARMMRGWKTPWARAQ